MNTLKYKGYLGSVGYSEEDKIFFGKIEGIDDLVNYEGVSVAELTTAFHEAVEDYLVFCEEQGLKPEKSYSGSFNVRIAPLTHREIALQAAEAGLSLNAFIKQALEEAVKHPRPSDVVAGYNLASPQPVALQEPQLHYGGRVAVELDIPSKDQRLIQTLAERLGWTIKK